MPVTLVSTGVPASTYYRGSAGGAQHNYGQPSVPGASSNGGFRGAASGSVSQSASGNVSFAAHPGVWLVIATAGVFLWLHRTSIAS